MRARLEAFGLPLVLCQHTITKTETTRNNGDNRLCVGTNATSFCLQAALLIHVRSYPLTLIYKKENMAEMLNTNPNWGNMR